MSVPTPILQYTLSDATMRGLLPAGYTPLAYIESTGTLWINTGWIITSNKIHYSCRFQLGDIVNSSHIFGGNNSYSVYKGNPYITSNVLYFYINTLSYYSETVYKDEMLDIDMDMNAGSLSLYLNGKLHTASYSGTMSGGNSIALFHVNANNGTWNVIKGKMYYFKMWDNGSLVVDLRPCIQDSNGAIGMYDLVSRTFKTNSGSGTFIAGPPLAVGKGGGKSLPEEYLLVEYLESTGTLWINTGYIPNNTSGIYLKAYCTTSDGNHTVIGCRLDSGDTRWWINYSSTLELSWNSWTGTISNYTNTWTEVKHNYMNSRSANVNGTNYSVNYPTLANITYSAYLFKGNGPNVTTSTFEGKISNVKITEGTATVRNMYPCYRKSDMKPGMYDTVNGVFYTNAGSGEFILGPSITNCYTWEPNTGRPNLVPQWMNISNWTNDGCTASIIGNTLNITYGSSSNARVYYSTSNVWTENGGKYLVSGLIRSTSGTQTVRFSRSCVDYGSDVPATTTWTKFSTIITLSDTSNGGTLSIQPSGNILIRDLDLLKTTISTRYADGLYTNVSSVYDSSKGWVASGSDTSASYIEFDKTIMNTLMTAKTFSISFWFRVHNTNRHILFGNATTSVYPLNIEYGSSKMRYYFASAPDLSGSTSISINTWYHFALSVTSTGFKGYINGNTDANYTSAPTFTQYTGNLRIGSDWRVDSGNNIFMGADISNFMIFDTALTAAQVKELYGK